MQMDSVLHEAMQRARKYDGRYGRDTAFMVMKAISRISGGASLLHRFATANKDDDFDDFLAEAWYVAAFLQCGYQVQIEPEGSLGPDLLILNQEGSSYVEVTRFRPRNPGPPLLMQSETTCELNEYGNPSRDVKKSINKIFHKFRQSIMPLTTIAIWNDDESLEEVEVREAVTQLRERNKNPHSIELVLYGSTWISDRQFFSFKLVDQPSEWLIELANHLRSVSLRQAVHQMLPARLQ